VLGDEEVIFVARAVSNAAEFYVVGRWHDPNSDDDHAFIWEEAQGVDTVTDLDPAGGWITSEGIDINANLLVAGTSWHPEIITCEPRGDASAWDLSPIALLQPTGFGGQNELSGSANGVNEADELAGYGDQEDETNCLNRALFWPDTQSVPDDLHDTGEVDPVEQTVAEAINEASPRVVVGTNTEDQLAIRFVEDGADWDYSVLEDLISSSCGWNALNSAMDVNDAGWIVGHGQGPYQGKIRAYLLVPLGPCPWDVDGINGVGSSDLTQLYLNWGACPEGAICWADVNGNCAVDSQDLSDVFVHWGACPGGESSGGGSPPSLAEVIMLFEGNSEAILAAVEFYAAMGWE
jgi:hypothetical protein